LHNEALRDMNLGSLDAANLRILHYPDPRLRQKAEPVREFGAALAPLIERMFALMKEFNGVGLAAPQVGVPLRLFVMNTTGEPSGKRVICNPRLTPDGPPEEAEEGCLSLPGIRVGVRRAQSCVLTAQDETGAAIEESGTNLVARVWQHETDHLDGVLIIDKMGPSDRIATRRTLRALEEAHKG
jgi:peptide deformylase